MAHLLQILLPFGTSLISWAFVLVLFIGFYRLEDIGNSRTPALEWIGGLERNVLHFLLLLYQTNDYADCVFIPIALVIRCLLIPELI